jgi:hypothetical protein
LAETIVALFILVAGGMACVSLALSAYRYQAGTLQAASAAQLSNQVLDRVRDWSRTPANFNSNWAIYQDAQFSNPDFPGFRIRVQCGATQRNIYSPSGSLEASRPGGGRRLGTAMPVQVTVSWGSEISPRRHFLRSMLYGYPETVRAVNPVTVELAAGHANPLAKDGSVTAKAHLWNADGQEITGVPFRWSVTTKDLGGMGTMDDTLDLSSRQARLLNYFYTGDPATSTRTYVPGEVLIAAVARYQGVEYAGFSDVVVLDGP